MSDIALRPAVADDARDLTRCLEAAYALAKSSIPDLPDVSEGVGLAIADEETQVWVAATDQVMGGMFLEPTSGWLQLSNIAVHPLHGGKGVGKALMQLAEREAIRQGYTQLRLKTHAAMTDNVAMYQRAGWSIVEEQGATIEMIKQLNLSDQRAS